MTTETAVDASADPWLAHRRIIFAGAGLAQGAAIHLIARNGEQWIADGAARGAVFVAIGVLPVLFYLTCDRHRWLEALAYGAGLALVLGAAHFWIAARLHWLPGDLGPTMLSSAVVTAVVAYVTLPFFQIWALTRRFRFPYADLFGHAWDNGLGALAAAVFVGALWLLLWLWAALFRLVDIDFFGRVFERGWFALPVSAAAFGLGIALLREHARIVRAVRALVFALARALAPVLPVAAVLFLVLLPFAGVEVLWRTGHATAILLAVGAIGILLANLVTGSGGEGRPSRTVAWPVMAVLVVLPVYVALAFYAAGLRIGQHGLTPERVYAIVLIVAVGVYAFVYGYAVLRHKSEWGWAIRRYNPVLAVIVAAIALLTQTPVIDPYRLSANQQRDRLISGQGDAATFDYGYLAYRLGAHGRRAIERIRADAGASGNTEMQAALAALDNSRSYGDWRVAHGEMERAQSVRRFGLLVDYVLVLPEGESLPEGFEAHLVRRQPSLLAWCHRAPIERCAIIVADLSGDDGPELVFARRYGGRSIGFEAYRGEGAAWQVYDRWQSRDAEAIWTAMLRSEISVVAPEHRLLRVGGVTLPIFPRYPSERD